MPSTALFLFIAATLPPALGVTPAPTLSPTTFRTPDHEFDFRGCTANALIPDTGTGGSGITATAKNGATCSAEGMAFDGTDDYVDVTPWHFGDEPLTVEAYVKYEAFNSWSRVFDFSTGSTSDDTVVLANFFGTGGHVWEVRVGPGATNNPTHCCCAATPPLFYTASS